MHKEKLKERTREERENEREKDDYIPPTNANKRIKKKGLECFHPVSALFETGWGQNPMPHQQIHLSVHFPFHEPINVKFTVLKNSDTRHKSYPKFMTKYTNQSVPRQISYLTVIINNRDVKQLDNIS